MGTMQDILGCPPCMYKSAADKTLAIAEILSIAANIKAIHVKTGKYSQHMALD